MIWKHTHPPFTAAQSQVTGIWSLLQPPVKYHKEFSPISWVKGVYKLENCKIQSAFKKKIYINLNTLVSTLTFD